MNLGTRLVRIVALGFGVWAIPFATGVALFRAKQWNAALFDSLMAVAVCVAAVLMSRIYFKKPGSGRASSYFVGVAWLVICWAIDFPLFVIVFDYNPWTYAVDIGVTYLIVPVVAIGLGTSLDRLGQQNASYVGIET